MRIACPQCSSSDVSCIHEIVKDVTDNMYFIDSKCNICNFIGHNTTFWQGVGTFEKVNTTEVNRTEKEIWEKKNV